jgi:hypothetical protein
MFREAGDWFAMTSLWISRDTLVCDVADILVSTNAQTMAGC